MITRAFFVPTGRAALLVAAAAPAALLLAVLVPGSWAAAPLLGSAVLALVVLDALLAGRAKDLAITLLPDVEVGEPGWLNVLARFGGGWRSRVECALGSDARLDRKSVV